MPRPNELLESIRQKVSMSKQIVSQKDQDYGYYAGGSFEMGSKMAKIDTIMRFGLIPKEYVPILKLYRAYLDQQRKAFFATIGSTEISKLGFILGVISDSIDASNE